MKSHIAKSVVYFKNVIEFRNDLKERYLQGDRVRVAPLYQDISNFKQGGLKIYEYFT